MTIASLLDKVLIGSIVLLCLMYVGYLLSPLRIQRLMLSYLVKCVGLRVFGWLSPKPGGCGQCAGAAMHPLKVNHTDKAKRLMKDSKP